MKLANLITCSRIFLIIPIIWFSSKGGVFGNTIALVLFILAASTDYFDGYLARKTNGETQLGALLDLLADKLLVCILLIWIVYSTSNFWILIPSLIIISREIIISSIRQFLAERNSANMLTVSKLGKIKTTFQLISIGLLIILGEKENYLSYSAISLVWLASFLSILSCYKYIKNLNLDH